MQKTNRNRVVIGRAKRRKLLIGEKTWNEIEEISKIKIRPKLRLKYQRALNYYLQHGPSSLQMTQKSRLISRIGTWITRTTYLQRELSEQARLQPKPKQVASTYNGASIQKIMGRYFSDDLYVERNITTDDISRVLEGAMKLSWSLWLAVDHQKNHDPIEYWLAWVAMLISITREDGSIKVAWTNGRKKAIHKHFIHLVQELQRLLPPDSCPRKKYDSIHKGIILALPIAQQEPLFQLKAILKAWHSGDAEFLDQRRVHRVPSMYTPGRVVDRIKTQMITLRRRKNLGSS